MMMVVNLFFYLFFFFSSHYLPVVMRLLFEDYIIKRSIQYLLRII